jgi:pimeloyl-ACP methyl ester carboxylesterase
MEKSILIAVLAIAVLLFFGFVGRTPQETAAQKLAPLDSGRFVIQQGDIRVGTEDYSLLYGKGTGYMLLSQVTLSVGKTQETLAAQYQLTPDFGLVFYQAGIQVQSESIIASAQPENGGIRLARQQGGQTKSVDVGQTKNALVLDNNLTSPYVLLLLAAESHAIDRDFTALIPQIPRSLPAHLDGPNTETFTSGSDTYDGQVYMLQLGDATMTLLAYKGHLVALFFPSRGVEAVNTDLFPKGVSLAKTTSKASDLLAGAVEKDVTFQSGAVTLAGTLTLPQNAAGPVPGVLLLAGSGPVDRNENAPGEKTDVLNTLAGALARAGIGSLRYDKRGIGKSGGTYGTESFEDLVADAQAAFETLSTEPGIDPSRLFVLGHSEGGIIGPMLAAKDSDVKGLVLLAAPAHPLDWIIREQVEAIDTSAGMTQAQIQAALAGEDQYLAFVRGSHGNWSDYTFDELKQAMPWLTQEKATQLAATSLTWLRQEFAHNPLETIRQVTCPVLILQGEKDIQVPSSEAGLLASALKEAGNTSVTTDVLPDLNHLMRHQTEAPNLTYRHLDEPVDPRVVQAVTQWIADHSGSGG